MTRRYLAAGLTALTLAAPAQSWAQGQANLDSDLDGVNDAIDALPCDPSVSVRVYAPADRTYGMLLFEDQWPSKGDFDFNDAVIAYNQTLRYDSGGLLTGLHIELSILAVGARFQNGLALRLPNTPRASVSSLTFTTANVVNTTAGDVHLDPVEAEATLILTDDLHALFGVDSTREWVNTDPSLPPHPFVDIVIDVGLTPGHNLSAADAPFDLFLFDRTRGAEVHRPRYRGTAALDPALYNTKDDGTSVSRAFVTTQGIPFVLELPELAAYPVEGAAIDQLYPTVVGFGASAGATNADYYRNPVGGHAYGLVPPRALQGAASPDVSCFVPNPGVCGAAVGQGSVDAPTAGLCGFGAASAVTTSGGLFRWSCTGDYSTPTSCTTPDWVCPPNLAAACPIPGGAGSQTCNGSGSGYGACTVTSCSGGFYQSGNSCVAQACTPGSTTACSIANGTARQTCDSLGAAHGACTLVSCNSGYTQSGNSCVQNQGSGNPRVPWPDAPQLYCNGGCTWDSVSHCGQGDADIFCRLTSGNAASRATSYTLGTALPVGGFSCGAGTNLRALRGHGLRRQRVRPGHEHPGEPRARHGDHQRDLHPVARRERHPAVMGRGVLGVSHRGEVGSAVRATRGPRSACLAEVRSPRSTPWSCPAGSWWTAAPARPSARSSPPRPRTSTRPWPGTASPSAPRAGGAPSAVGAGWRSPSRTGRR